MKSSKKSIFRGFIDRLEGNIAVVFLGEEEEVAIEIPVSLLPPQAKEGTILTFKISAAPDKTKKAKEKVTRMIEKLRSRRA